MDSVRLKNAGLTKATLLDANGYAAGDVEVKREQGGVVIELSANAMYVLLR